MCNSEFNTTKFRVLPHWLAYFKGSILLGCLTLVTILSISVSSAQESKRHAYMGVGSCSSSNCHGSVSPRNSSNVLQNEYTIWEKEDPHSKAWLNVTGEDSKRIAHNLGIQTPERDPTCLKCHATYLGDKDREGTNYHIEDGVSCETCHGAAENYLGPHTARDATHQENLNQGMRDINSSEKRVELCAACHFGTSDAQVDHRLIGAGHPRLSFELDTFSMIQPRHWVVDEDYISRKGDYSSARSWIVGQIYLAKKTIARLGDIKQSKRGIFPELTIFSCYSCHHSLTEDQWKTREYGGTPGELVLNLSSVNIVRETIEILDPKVFNNLSASIKKLHGNYKNGSVTELDEITKLLVEAEKLVSKNALSKVNLRKILIRLAAIGAKGTNTQYEDAEQVAMGISSILASIPDQEPAVKAELDAIYASLRDSDTFKVQEFKEACKRFQAKL